jgi:hypothetical protein
LANAGHSQAASVKQQQRQASVEDVEDQSSIPVNNPPKNPNALLEAANGSDDDVEMLENDPPPLEDTEPYGEDDEDEDEDEPEIVEKPIETFTLLQNSCPKSGHRQFMRSSNQHRLL